MFSALYSRALIVVFGLLYPAYKSYKALKFKDSKEHVRLMMYWIVLALFTVFETIADVFVSWIPFYYELKIGFIFWLISPITNGSSFLYRKFVHPYLQKQEKEIDEAIDKASEKGYAAIYTYLVQIVNYTISSGLMVAVKCQDAIAGRVQALPAPAHASESHKASSSSISSQQRYAYSSSPPSSVATTALKFQQKTQPSPTLQRSDSQIHQQHSDYRTRPVHKEVPTSDDSAATQPYPNFDHNVPTRSEIKGGLGEGQSATPVRRRRAPTNQTEPQKTFGSPGGLEPKSSPLLGGDRSGSSSTLPRTRTNLSKPPICPTSSTSSTSSGPIYRSTARLSPPPGGNTTTPSYNQ